MRQFGLPLFLLILLCLAPLATAQPGVQPQEAPPGMQGQQPHGEQAPPPKQEPVQLHEMFPALEWDRLNSWKQEVVYTGGPVPKNIRGCFPIGDGWCFGYLGMGKKANTIQGLTGPSYQTAKAYDTQGGFGQVTLHLMIDGKEVALPKQRVGMIQEAPIAWTEDKAENGIALRGVTMAFSGPRYPEGMTGVEAGKAALDPFRCLWTKAPHRTIYRIYDIYNGSDKPLRKVDVHAKFSATGTTKGGAMLFTHKVPGGRDRMMQARFVERSKAADDGMHRGIDEILPGKFGRVILLLHFFYADERKPDPDDYLDEDCLRVMGEVQGWWHLRLQHTTRFRSDNKRFMDLVEGWKVKAAVLQALPGGGVSTMVNQHGVLARDQAGIILAYLRFGMWNEARKALTYYYNCVRHTGKVKNYFPADYEFLPDMPDPDWKNVEVENNEVAAWVLLQNYWYYRATGDVELLRKRWQFFRCLVNAQKPIDGVFFPFPANSDCTHGGLNTLFPERTDYPNQLIADQPDKGRLAYSYEGSLLHILSLHGLSDIASVIGDATKEGKAKQKWQDRKTKLIERALTAGQKMEEIFWMPSPGVKQEPGKLSGYYTPAIYPFGMKPHTAPIAAINLKPLWMGYLFAMGNRDTANVKETISLLWQDKARVGSTPSVSRILGCTQGYLVGSLTQLEDRSLPDAVDNLMNMASPSGEWAEIHGRDGKPSYSTNKEWPNRLHQWNCGVNLDALLYAVTGIRCAAVPAFDPSTLRLNPRVPKGGTFFAGDGVKHDKRLFDFSARLAGDRINVRILNRGEKKADLALGLLHNLYIRYIEPGQDEYIEEVAPGIFVSKDNPGYREDVFARANRKRWAPMPLPLPQMGTDILFVTAIPGAEKKLGDPGKIHVVDIGLAITPGMLAQLMLGPGNEPRVRKVIFDTGIRETSTLTMKTTTFWQDPVLLKALAAFRKAGGTIINR